jgi:hypothetical protein
MVAPPKYNAAYGLDPDRDTHLAQIGRIGPPAWKRRIGHSRLAVGSGAQVESSFGAIKKVCSHRTRATSFAGAVAEINSWIWVVNQSLARTPLC